MNKKQKIAFLGGGNMSNALINGLIDYGYQPHDIHIIDVVPDIVDKWHSKGFSTSIKPDEKLLNFDVWVLSVKPQFLHEALQQCLPYLKKDTLVISIAAGISAESISTWLTTDASPHKKLVRCMPNTPALVSAGITGVLALEDATDQDKAITNDILQAVGQVVWVDSDDEINAVTAISGSGPAYVFLFINSMVNAGLELGLSESQAKQLAIATVSGATKLAKLSDESLITLKEKVTSKGGTTAAALSILEDNKALETLVKSAANSAYQRAIELSEELQK